MRTLLFVSWFMVGIGAMASAASAQTRDDPGTDRATEFRAVQGAVREDVPGGPLLVAAYGVAWTVVLLYVLRLGLLHTGLRKDIDRLEQAVNAKPSPEK